MKKSEQIGRLVAEHRNACGLSVRALAAASGVSAQNITKIENGKYNPSIDLLDKLISAMGCEITITKRQEE